MWCDVMWCDIQYYARIRLNLNYIFLEKYTWIFFLTIFHIKLFDQIFFDSLQSIDCFVNDVNTTVKTFCWKYLSRCLNKKNCSKYLRGLCLSWTLFITWYETGKTWRWSWYMYIIPNINIYDKQLHALITHSIDLLSNITYYCWTKYTDAILMNWKIMICIVYK